MLCFVSLILILFIFSFCVPFFIKSKFLGMEIGDRRVGRTAVENHHYSSTSFLKHRGRIYIYIYSSSLKSVGQNKSTYYGSF